MVMARQSDASNAGSEGVVTSSGVEGGCDHSGCSYCLDGAKDGAKGLTGQNAPRSVEGCFCAVCESWRITEANEGRARQRHKAALGGPVNPPPQPLGISNSSSTTTKPRGMDVVAVRELARRLIVTTMQLANSRTEPSTPLFLRIANELKARCDQAEANARGMGPSNPKAPYIDTASVNEALLRLRSLSHGQLDEELLLSTLSYFEELHRQWLLANRTKGNEADVDRPRDEARGIGAEGGRAGDGEGGERERPPLPQNIENERLATPRRLSAQQAYFALWKPMHYSMEATMEGPGYSIWWPGLYDLRLPDGWEGRDAKVHEDISETHVVTFSTVLWWKGSVSHAVELSWPLACYSADVVRAALREISDGLFRRTPADEPLPQNITQQHFDTHGHSIAIRDRVSLDGCDIGHVLSLGFWDDYNCVSPWVTVRNGASWAHYPAASLEVIAPLPQITDPTPTFDQSPISPEYLIDLDRRLSHAVRRLGIDRDFGKAIDQEEERREKLEERLSQVESFLRAQAQGFWAPGGG